MEPGCNNPVSFSLYSQKVSKMTRQEITQFYQEHHGRLYNIALRILHDSGEAEEAMQDTILKYVSGGQEFDSAAQISAWLARTCIHDAIDRLRKRQRRDAFLEDYALEAGESPVEPANDGNDEPANDGGNLPANAGGALPDIGRVKAAMEALPEPYRLVLNLVLIEGLDYAEIADYTGQKETTLRSLYSRGRNKLVELLKR